MALRLGLRSDRSSEESQESEHGKHGEHGEHGEVLKDPVHSAALTAWTTSTKDADVDWIQAWRASASDPVQTLRALADTCQNQEGRLQEEVTSLDRQLSEAYAPLQKEPYHLYGIWVHQGQEAEARSGHYVAFLKDWRKNRWMRFSDSSVQVATWEEVRKAALGGDCGEGEGGTSPQNAQSGAQNVRSKSRSSAYVLVYMEAGLAESQQKEPDAAGDLVRLIPAELLEEIQTDNRALQNERGSWQEQVKVRELRQHAQAIFQEYAMLLHRWEPKKRLGDASGNPHSQDPNHRKQLNDPVPWMQALSIELSAQHRLSGSCWVLSRWGRAARAARTARLYVGIVGAFSLPPVSFMVGNTQL